MYVCMYVCIYIYIEREREKCIEVDDIDDELSTSVPNTCDKHEIYTFLTDYCNIEYIHTQFDPRQRRRARRRRPPTSARAGREMTGPLGLASMSILAARQVIALTLTCMI